MCWLPLCLVVWPRLDDLFISRNPRKVYVSHFLGQTPCCAYTTCSYVQKSVSCTIPRESLSSIDILLSLIYFYFDRVCSCGIFFKLLSYSFKSFSHQRPLIVFRWSRVTASLLKSPGLFSVFSSILIILLSGWSPLVLLFQSPPCPWTNSFGIVPSAPMSVGITVTFMFQRFFSSLARS